MTAISPKKRIAVVVLAVAAALALAPRAAALGAVDTNAVPRSSSSGSKSASLVNMDATGSVGVRASGKSEKAPTIRQLAPNPQVAR